MKKISSPSPKPASVELRPEYDLDYSRAKRNRFADRFQAGAVAVVLDPDVATVFQSSEAVNTLLRSVIAALPTAQRVAKTRPRPSARKTV